MWSRKLLHHYLLDLEEGPLESKHDPRLLCANDLDLLLGFIRTGYSPTTERLVPVLEQHQITYDLLWTLFKPNGLAHTKCFGTGQPRCVRYRFGEKENNKSRAEVLPRQRSQIGF